MNASTMRDTANSRTSGCSSSNNGGDMSEMEACKRLVNYPRGRMAKLERPDYECMKSSTHSSGTTNSDHKSHHRSPGLRNGRHRQRGLRNGRDLDPVKQRELVARSNEAATSHPGAFSCTPPDVIRQPGAFSCAPPDAVCEVVSNSDYGGDEVSVGSSNPRSRRFRGLRTARRRNNKKHDVSPPARQSPAPFPSSAHSETSSRTPPSHYSASSSEEFWMGGKRSSGRNHEPQLGAPHPPKSPDPSRAAGSKSVESSSTDKKKNKPQGKRVRFGDSDSVHTVSRVADKDAPNVDAQEVEELQDSSLDDVACVMFYSQWGQFQKRPGALGGNIPSWYDRVYIPGGNEKPETSQDSVGGRSDGSAALDHTPDLDKELRLGLRSLDFSGIPKPARGTQPSSGNSPARRPSLERGVGFTQRNDDSKIQPKARAKTVVPHPNKYKAEKQSMFPRWKVTPKVVDSNKSVRLVGALPEYRATY